MIEQAKRAVMLFAGAALFSAGAWGQTIHRILPNAGVIQFVTTPPVTVASEYFGGGDEGRVVNMGGRARTVGLIFVPLVNSGGTDFNYAAGPDAWRIVTDRNVIDLTYTLNGGTFASAVNSTALTISRRLEVTHATLTNVGSRTKSIDVQVNREDGGGVGDSSVTFRLEVHDDGLMYARQAGHVGAVFPASDAAYANLPTDSDGKVTVTAATGYQTTEQDTIRFVLPSIRVTGGGVVTNPRQAGANYAASTATDEDDLLRGVYVTVSSTEVSGSGGPNNRFPAVHGTYDHDGDQNTPNNRVNPSQGLLLQMRPVLTVGLGEGQDAAVSIGARTVLAAGSVAAPAAAGSGARGLRVGVLNAVASGTATTLEGGTAPAAVISGNLHRSLAASAMVSVSGEFRDGDKVYVGSTEATMNDAGTEATATVALTNLPSVTGSNVLYVPNSMEALRPASFRASVSVAFTDPLNNGAGVSPATGDAKMQTANINYGGVSTKAYAYGIVRNGGLDVSWLRVGCLNPPAGTDGCTVFLDCRAQDGTNYFGELDDPIPAYNTVSLNSAGVADTFPGGSGWSTGRGNCTMLSDGDLEVQHNIRRGDIQVPNNDVVGSTSGSVGSLRK